MVVSDDGPGGRIKLVEQRRSCCTSSLVSRLSSTSATSTAKPYRRSYPPNRAGADHQYSARLNTVLQRLGRRWAYTTVQETLLQRLETKGYVVSDRAGRARLPGSGLGAMLW